MIFITVGTQKFPLNRLLKQIDNLILAGNIKEDVFAQIGNCDYIPQNYEYKEFLSKEEFEKYVSRCSVLITHSGVGSIISGINKHKPVIVFPRLAKYDEHVDDHQLEIAQSFAEVGYVLMCNENDSLLDVLNESKTHKFEEYKSQREEFINSIKDYLKTI